MEVCNTYNFYREEAGGITYADLQANKSLSYYKSVEALNKEVNESIINI